MSTNCCECGRQVHRRGNRGPSLMRCKSCKQARDRASRARKRTSHQHKCEHCGALFSNGRRKQRACSAKCRSELSKVQQRLRHHAITVDPCARPGCSKMRKRGTKYCSKPCRMLHQYPPPLTCHNPKCGRAFRMKHQTKNTWKNAGKYCCPECYRDHRWGQHRRKKKSPQTVCRAAAASALATSLRKRCKAFGVTFDPACTRMAVLERDGWRCQKCRVLCNKEYRLSSRTKSPHWRNAEHDHIVPLSVAGSPGNVFQNSQCLCRRCNAAKSDKRDGQLRLPIEEEAWGKGVRVRSPRSSRFSEAIPATVL